MQILQTDYVEKCKPKPKPAYNPYKPKNGDEEEEEEEDSQANIIVSHKLKKYNNFDFRQTVLQGDPRRDLLQQAPGM